MLARTGGAAVLGPVNDGFVAAILRHAPDDGIHASALPRLHLIRSSRPTEPLAALHAPALCLVAQGRKEVMLGAEVFAYGPAQFLAVSLDAPVVGQVTEASAERPYLCLRLDVDVGLLGALVDEAGEGAGPNAREAAALELGASTPEITDAAARLVRLLDHPPDAAVLGTSTARELLYRVLRSPNSDGLRAILSADSGMARVARAIAHLKATYREPFCLERVAAAAGMSTSALHERFRRATSLSPLQYQKTLRLHEARRLLLNGGTDAANAGHAVGYGSPSQFSRDYSRLFGAAPMRDVARFRARRNGGAWGAEDAPGRALTAP